MAGVISISSDEEQADDCVENPTKKAKIDPIQPIICLDDDEEKNKMNETDEDIILLQNGTDSNIIEIQNNSQAKIECKEEDTSYDIVIDSDDDEREINGATDEREVDGATDEQEVEDTSDDKLEDKDEGVCSGTTEDQSDFQSMFERSVKMLEFINLCLSKIDKDDTKSLFISKIPFCKKLFDKMEDEYISSDDFNSFLDEKIRLGSKNSISAIASFNDVYQLFKSKLRSKEMNSEIDDKHKVVIAKLERALRQVQKRIVSLEEAEVNFDEEDDSNYIKMQRYRERAVKIYEKICKYRKEDVHAGNILYSRLDFAGSNYPEFNHAINKKFKNNSVFPTYYDLERCLQKTVKDKNMNISDRRFKEEARECFKCLGNLLQRRRKMDLLNIHSAYLIANDDPAFENKELEVKLHANSKEAKSKIDEICEKYVRLQDSGIDPTVSSDSDDSKRESTDDEGI